MRRQARMGSHLDEEEEVVETQNSDEQADASENASETVPRIPDEHLDIDSEFRSGKGRFKNWPDVVKIANEVLLDEMKALLETRPQFLLMQCATVVSAASPCVAWRRRGFGPVYGVDRPTAKKRRKEPEKADSSVQRALSCDGNESECRKLLRKLS